MISSDTPYKLAEIIRDTWPQLYRYAPTKEKTSGESEEEKDVHT
jgi:hypothetical protein